MTKLESELYISTGRKRMNPIEWASYSWLLLLAFSPLLIILISTHQNLEWGFIELLLLAIPVAYAIHLYKSISFKKYRLTHTEIHFFEAIKATSMRLGWINFNLSKYGFEGHQELNSFSNVKITIARTGHKIYIHLIEKGQRTTQIYGANKIISTFNNNLLQATRGIDVIQETTQYINDEQLKIENTSQWNFQNSLLRTVGYLWFFILIVLSILLLKHEEELILLPLLLIALCLLCAYWDYKNIRKDWLRRKKN